MMSFDEYKAAELQRMENVYARCRVVEDMRRSDRTRSATLAT